MTIESEEERARTTRGRNGRTTQVPAGPEMQAQARPASATEEPARPEHAASSTGRRRLRDLDPSVRTLGWVSLLADFSSEMIYPLFPAFITSVLGAPAAVLGLVEGIAEATASISRYPFGQWSDYLGRRRLFTVGGYGLAAAGKLILAVSFVWPVALLARFVDRLGKGMRVAPRDALIAAASRPEERGLAFGLHRAMDTIGAVVGPLVALLFIELHTPLRWVFAVAAVPGVLSVLLILWKVADRRSSPQPTAFRLALPHSPAYRWLLAGTIIFAVGNSSDMFILLKAQTVIPAPAGYPIAAGVILMYVLYNVVYSAGSIPLGGLSDRVGQFPLVLAGFVVFAVVYAGFAVASSWPALALLFACYGLYMAATEGTSKALVTRAIPEQEHGAGLGLYYTASGLAAFAASLLGGVFWSAFGPQATFIYGSACAVLGAFVLTVARVRLGPSAGLHDAGQDAG